MIVLASSSTKKVATLNLLSALNYNQVIRWFKLH